MAFHLRLKTSQLEEIIKNEDIKTDVTLEYWKPQIIGSILEVHYWLHNENIPYNRLYIRAGALLKNDVQSAKKGLVLPEFLKWIKNIEQLDESSTHKTERYFEGYYENNKVLISKD